MKKVFKRVEFVISLTMALGIFLVTSLFISGCSYRGYDMIDNNYHFDYAYISLPNGEVVEGPIRTWADSEGEQLTITLSNGNRYLCSSYNCVLVEYN